MNEVRKLKIQSLLQEIIGSMILEGDIKDPRINSFLSISSVKVSADLSGAQVFVSSFQSDKTVEKAVEALNHASGFIHERLKKKLSLRVVPRVRFHADDSIQSGMALNRKIDELNQGHGS